MATSVIIFFITLLSANCAVIKGKDAVHERIARCSSCGPQGPGVPFVPLPPPPPPLFRAQQWSGYSRSTDGSQEGVFSGSAVASGTNKQTTGQALALASSSVADPLGGGNAATLANRGDFVHSANDNLAPNYSANNNYNTISSYPTQRRNAQNTDDSFSSSSSQASSGFQNEQQKSQNLGYVHFQEHKDSENQKTTQGIAQLSQGGQKREGNDNQGSKYPNQLYRGDVENNGGFASSSSHAESTLDNNEQQTQVQGYNIGQQNANYEQGKVENPPRHFGNGQNDNNFRGSEGKADNHNQNQVGPSANPGPSNKQIPLGGALGLAREGLQAAQLASQQPPGCTTCGKNTYAFSKAKSVSGSAVAISIGG